MNTNIFRKKTNFRIQKQLLLLLLLSTALPVAIVGGYGAMSFTKVASRSLIEEFEKESVERAYVIESFLQSIEGDVQFIAKSYLLSGLLQAQSNGYAAAGLSIETWKQQFVGNVTALMTTKSAYQEIRYVDETGQEVIRVQRDNQDRSRIEIVSTSVLTNQKEFPSVAAALTLAPGQIHISGITLQHEQGEVPKTFGGIAHYAAPVFDETGRRRGLIIVDVFADEIFNVIHIMDSNVMDSNEVDDGEGKALFIVDADGYYLQHSEASKMRGFELGNEDRLQTDYAEKPVAAMLASGQGVVSSGQILIAYARVDPNPDQAHEHFYIAEALPKRSVYGPANTFRNVAILVTLLALAVVLPIGLLRGHQLIGLVERLINGISTSSQQIFSTVSEQERIASQQAASVSQTSATMEKLEASSRRSSEQAMAAVGAAKTAHERADVGAQAVDDTLTSILTLEQKVEAIAQQIVNLSGQAGEIGSISQLVSDFASQTNMLALNSSVEAVRAGEHGRGFAVVANEIRKLSEQSQQSAAKIKALVADIQKLINKTVMVTEEGTKTAKSGVKIAKLTEQAFDDIKKGTDAVVMNNQQVSLTQKQQVDAIRQVVTAMGTIERSSKESVTGLSQTRSGIEKLSETARSLRDMM